MKPKFVKRLPFEDAKQYVQSKQNRAGLEEVELQRKRIKNKNLKPLLQEDK